MATTVVSGFSKDGYELYGKRFIETFCRFAPIGIDLIVYTAEPVPMPRGRYVLHSELDGAEAFAAKHRGIPEHCGQAPTPTWRKKDVRHGYSYRHDAVKFCWQLFYPEHAAKSLPDGDIQIWFDGDVVFTDQIRTGVLESGFAGGHDLVYLGRETHSELGFWGVKLSPMTREFLRYMPDLYRSGAVFRLPEWHSAYIFDFTRSGFSLKENNLTPGGKGNVWLRTPLNDFSLHMKGNLKQKT